MAKTIHAAASYTFSGHTITLSTTELKGHIEEQRERILFLEGEHDTFHIFAVV